MLCMNLKAMPAQETSFAKLVFIVCVCGFFFLHAQGYKRCRNGCIIIRRFALHVYPFAFPLKTVVAETAAASFSSAPQPDAQNRAICEQTATSACSQQRIPAGVCSFILTSAATIYSAGCVVILCILFFPSVFFC